MYLPRSKWQWAAVMAAGLMAAATTTPAGLAATTTPAGLAATTTPAGLAATTTPAGLAAAAMPAGLANTTTPVVLAAASNASAGPRIKLIVAQNYFTVPRFGKQVFVDPGIYVASLGSPLQFDVQRASYTKPLTITQVIYLPGGRQEVRPLPAWVVDGWNGVRRFVRLTVTNADGKIVGSSLLPFCPDELSAQRTNPDSAVTSPFPQVSCSSDPFEQGMVLGIARGWGVDPYSGGGIGFGPGNIFNLRLGTYTATVNITRTWVRLLHIAKRDAVAHVRFTVVKGSGCSDICPPHPGTAPGGTLPRLPSVPELRNPPSSVLPDLVALPSWGISVQHFSGPKGTPGNDQMQFGATVWIGGNSPLDVEGFRSHGSPVMPAYQYFWRNGRVIGRARAGTMGFDGKKGHNHWHFQQFAQYRLLNSTKSLVLRSQKVGFCIAPTDAVDLVLPHATWVPSFTGLGGACGSPSALWVQEMLPVGWGDTYFQSVAGQSFDITNLPNGTYYIEIIANPEKVLHESKYGNDISLRKVILGGRPGHRTVRVPAWHGIDPEG